jgi:hypothetical protein
MRQFFWVFPALLFAIGCAPSAKITASPVDSIEDAEYRALLSEARRSSGCHDDLEFKNLLSDERILFSGCGREWEMFSHQDRWVPSPANRFAAEANCPVSAVAFVGAEDFSTPANAYYDPFAFDDHVEPEDDAITVRGCRALAFYLFSCEASSCHWTHAPQATEALRLAYGEYDSGWIEEFDWTADAEAVGHLIAEGGSLLGAISTSETFHGTLGSDEDHPQPHLTNPLSDAIEPYRIEMKSCFHNPPEAEPIALSISARDGLFHLIESEHPAFDDARECLIELLSDLTVEADVAREQELMEQLAHLESRYLQDHPSVLEVQEQLRLVQAPSITILLVPSQ